MSSNYPPGVSENTFGAPWNSREFEFEFKIVCSGELDGPLSEEDYEEIVKEIKNIVRKQLNQIEFLGYIEEI